MIFVLHTHYLSRNRPAATLAISMRSPPTVETLSRHNSRSKDASCHRLMGEVKEHTRSSDFATLTELEQYKLLIGTVIRGPLRWYNV